MTRGPSGKRGLFSLQKLGFTCIINQMKEIIFSLSINVSNFENKNGGRKWYLKRFFLCFYF